MSEAEIKTGDRVRIIAGDYAGRGGIVRRPEPGPMLYVDTDPAGDPVYAHEAHVHLEETLEDGRGRIVADDLKPRGVKRQWHLMPLDALGFALRYCEGLTLRVLDTLAEYQADPNEETAARMFGACLITLQTEHSTTLPAALDAVVRVFEHGAAKYSVDNWRGAAGNRDSFRREYLSAVCRHRFDVEGRLDPDSGLPHMAHACCGALMILWHERNTFQ